MKKISKLKLNAIVRAELAKREMEVLKGGFDGPLRVDVDVISRIVAGHQ